MKVVIGVHGARYGVAIQRGNQTHMWLGEAADRQAVLRDVGRTAYETADFCWHDAAAVCGLVMNHWPEGMYNPPDSIIRPGGQDGTDT